MAFVAERFIPLIDVGADVELGTEDGYLVAVFAGGVGGGCESYFDWVE